MLVQQNRTAVSLKELKNRMTTIASIKKITNSMNKLATSKLKKARDDMERIAKPLLEVSQSFLNLPDQAPSGKEVMILITTDRGMCGATNSALLRYAKRVMHENRKNTDFRLIIAGNKGNSALRRDFSKSYIATVGDLSRKRVSFADVEPLVNALRNQSGDYDRVRLVANTWQSVVSTEIQQRSIPHPSKIAAEMKEKFYSYSFDNGIADEVLENLQEHLTANFIYGALVENTAVELAARMNSMDNATTNAGRMHQQLGLLYNRTRQANITTELSEIISGAAAVMEADQ